MFLSSHVKMWNQAWSRNDEFLLQNIATLLHHVPFMGLSIIRSIRLEKLLVSSNPDPIIADSYLVWPCWQLFTFCLKAVRFFSVMLPIRGYTRILLLQSLETFSEFPIYSCCQADVPRSALSYDYRTTYSSTVNSMV